MSIPGEEVDDGTERVCDTLLMCIITVLNHGLRNGGGIADVLRKLSKEVSKISSTRRSDMSYTNKSVRTSLILSAKSMFIAVESTGICTSYRASAFILLSVCICLYALKHCRISHASFKGFSRFESLSGKIENCRTIMSC